MFRQEREELSGQAIETRMAEWLRAIQLVVKKLYPEAGGFLKSSPNREACLWWSESGASFCGL